MLFSDPNGCVTPVDALAQFNAGDREKKEEGEEAVRGADNQIETPGSSHRPATSNSISSVTLLVSAASRSSWLASSRVPSSVGMPLMDRRRSPTCSSPHLQTGGCHGDVGKDADRRYLPEHLLLVQCR